MGFNLILERLDNNNPSVLSKLDNQKIGEVIFNNASDVLNFLSTPFDLRGQNVIFNLKNVLEQNFADILKVLNHEIGKPVSQCEDELKRAIEMLANFEKIELSPQTNADILVLGSLACPIYEFSMVLAKYIHSFSKVVYKPSTKAAATLNFIYKKMCLELGISERVLVAPLNREALDKLLEKKIFRKVVKYSRGEFTKKIDNLEDFSRKDEIILLDNSSDVDHAVNLLVENIFNFEKFNIHRIQHVFVLQDNMENFCQKLISKLSLQLQTGDADDKGVNFSDTFKSYKREFLKTNILELISMGADVIYGGVEDVMTSPVVIKCDESMEEYYKEDFWFPVIFVVEYKKESALPVLLAPFKDKYEFISLLSNSDLIKNKFSLV